MCFHKNVLILSTPRPSVFSHKSWPLLFSLYNLDTTLILWYKIYYCYLLLNKSSYFFLKYIIYLCFLRSFVFLLCQYHLGWAKGPLNIHRINVWINGCIFYTIWCYIDVVILCGNRAPFFPNKTTDIVLIFGKLKTKNKKCCNVVFK